MSDQPPQPVSVLKVFLWVVVGVVLGGVAGAIAGIGLTMALTALVVATSDDPTAGSVAIIVIGLLPGGALFGAAGGAVLALKLNGAR